MTMGMTIDEVCKLELPIREKLELLYLAVDTASQEELSKFYGEYEAFKSESAQGGKNDESKQG